MRYIDNSIWVYFLSPCSSYRFVSNSVLLTRTVRPYERLELHQLPILNARVNISRLYNLNLIETDDIGIGDSFVDFECRFL